MKILYYSTALNSKHGGRTHAREFLKAAANNDSVTQIITYPPTIQSGRTAVPEVNIKVQPQLQKYILNLKIYLFKKLFIHYSLWNPSTLILNELTDLINKENPDLLIFRSNPNFRFLSKFRQLYPSLKICVEYNGTGFDEGLKNLAFNKFWREEEVRQICKADLISCVSEYLRDYLLSFDPGLDSKIIVNPNGVDPSTFYPLPNNSKLELREQYGIPKDAIVFGYIGGFEKFRRLPEVLECYIQVLKKGYEKLYLVYIGQGEDREAISNIYKEHDIALQQHFLFIPEWIEHELIPSMINLFDIGIFPFSNPYGSPQKIYEYAAIGLPIIGPDVPALTINTGRELCTQTITQNGSNLLSAIEDLYNNIIYYKKNAGAIRESVIENYTWKKNVERIICNPNIA